MKSVKQLIRAGRIGDVERAGLFRHTMTCREHGRSHQNQYNAPWKHSEKVTSRHGWTQMNTDNSFVF
jgi:hypothetical protein